jgi:hypothetical protein
VVPGSDRTTPLDLIRETGQPLDEIGATFAA